MSFEDCFSSFLPNFWCKYEIFQIFGKIWKKFASSNPFFGWLRLSDSPLTLSGTPCNHLYIKSSSLKNLANHQKRGIRTKLFLSRHEKYTLSHHRITIKIFAFHLEIWFFFLGMTTTSLVPKINFEAVMAAIQRHLECKYHNKEDYHCTG